jgi:ABC-type Na+ efflux pump permease subunit
MRPYVDTLVGRHPRVSVLGIGVAAMLVALGGLLGRPPTELWHVVVAVAAAVVPAATLAANNDGLLVCWAVAAAPAFGVALRVADAGGLTVAAQAALGVGLVAGTVAFLVGVGGRWVVAGDRPTGLSSDRSV